MNETFGEICVTEIRAHLVRTALKWGQLNGASVAQIIDRIDAIHRPKAKKTQRIHGRDLFFDAIAIACGCDLMGLTRNYAKQIATAKRDILEATPDLTVEEIDRRAKAYRAKYREAALTPMALANRWPEFGNAGEGKTRGAKADVYVEPVGWKDSERAQMAYCRGGVSKETWDLIVRNGWFEMAVDSRAAILKAIFP